MSLVLRQLALLEKFTEPLSPSLAATLADALDQGEVHLPPKDLEPGNDVRQWPILRWATTQAWAHCEPNDPRMRLMRHLIDATPAIALFPALHHPSARRTVALERARQLHQALAEKLMGPRGRPHNSPYLWQLLQARGARWEGPVSTDGLAHALMDGGALPAVKAWLNYGLDPNAPTSYAGFTLLGLATTPAQAQALLPAGADPQARPAGGLTAHLQQLLHTGAHRDMHAKVGTWLDTQAPMADPLDGLETILPQVGRAGWQARLDAQGADHQGLHKGLYWAEWLLLGFLQAHTDTPRDEAHRLNTLSHPHAWMRELASTLADPAQGGVPAHRMPVATVLDYRANRIGHPWSSALLAEQGQQLDQVATWVDRVLPHAPLVASDLAHDVLRALLADDRTSELLDGADPTGPSRLAAWLARSRPSARHPQWGRTSHAHALELLDGLATTGQVTLDEEGHPQFTGQVGLRLRQLADRHPHLPIAATVLERWLARHLLIPDPGNDRSTRTQETALKQAMGRWPAFRQALVRMDLALLRERLTDDGAAVPPIFDLFEQHQRMARRLDTLTQTTPPTPSRPRRRA